MGLGSFWAPWMAGGTGGDRALALLRERLARGEIDEEEVRRRRAVLNERGTSGAAPGKEDDAS
ncbi:MAG: hypothetical protein QJR14_08805 [Bacillota bacterium]|nr:hypothetical protein [Bacillota bacterium]